MIPRIVVAMLACAASAAGAYIYYATDDFADGIDAGKWQLNGTLSTAGGLLTTSDTNGGSLISIQNVPDGTSEYEVKVKLKLTGSGGSFAIFLRATSNARISPPTGTHYSFEITSINMGATSGCSATMNVYKTINGSQTYLGANLIACRDGMVIRAIARNNFMLAYVDNLRYGFVDNEITTGKAGVGVRGAPPGNGIQEAHLGPADRIAPSSINGSTLATSV